MATMNALMVEEIGKPVVFRKRPIPTPGEGEILIKVTVGARQSDLSPMKHHSRLSVLTYHLRPSKPV